jgi:putative transposase
MKYVKTEVKPYHGGYQVLVSMDDAKKLPQVPKDPARILGIDLGVRNFAAVAGNFGDAPFLIKGGMAKAQNQWFHKQRAKLMSSLTAGSDSRHSVKDSRALYALSRKREDFLRDYFYKCAWYICRYAKANRVEVIVAGHNTGQKQNSDLSKKYNQEFASLPHQKFLCILTNTAAKEGIPVISREESYTSKASLPDLDDMPTYGEEDSKAIFSGNRLKRGLYRSKDGILINADVNGAGNILRKEYPHAFDGVDMGYLTATTRVVGFHDLYPAGPARKKKHKRHRAGSGSRVRNRYRSDRRRVYRELFGTEKKIWEPEKEKAVS